MEITQVTESRKSNKPKDLATKIKDEAAKDMLFREVCEVFAKRQRTRQQITLHTLEVVMMKKGFKHTKEDYARVLGTMASLGLGTLQYNSKGRLQALKGIRVTLQSIGQAVIGKGSQLDSFAPKPHIAKLPPVPQNIIETALGHKTPPPMTKSMCKIVFTVTVDDKSVLFEVPEAIPKEELGQFIASLYPRKPRGVK